MLHKDYDRKCAVEKKLLVVSLKGLVGKRNLLALTAIRILTLFTTRGIYNEKIQ
jgi:hypothetical protein